MLRIVILAPNYLEDMKETENFKKEVRSENSNFRLRKRKKTLKLQEEAEGHKPYK